jgi:hypothetical protein
MVLMKMENKILVQSLYSKTMEREYIYSSIGDSEVILVFGRKNAGLKRLASFVRTERLVFIFRFALCCITVRRSLEKMHVSSRDLFTISMEYVTPIGTIILYYIINE